MRKVTGCHSHCPLGSAWSCSHWPLSVNWIRKTRESNLPFLTTVISCALMVKPCFTNCSPFYPLIFMAFSFFSFRKVGSLRKILISNTFGNYSGTEKFMYYQVIVIWLEIRRKIKLCCCVLFLRSLSFILFG